MTRSRPAGNFTPIPALCRSRLAVRCTWAGIFRAIARPLIDTAALARSEQTPSADEPFQQVVTCREKLLKQLILAVTHRHRAKAAVLMRSGEWVYEISRLAGLLGVCGALPLASVGAPPQLTPGEPKLVAQTYNSGFAEAHDSYNSMGTGSDGKIYYVLSTESYDVGAQMFCFDPRTKQIRRLGDLTEACGEQGRKAIPQGKSHVNFVEANGQLYFATHIGVYANINGRDTMGEPPPGYQPYPGGHFLAYDMASGKFQDLALNPNHDGIIAMTMDTKRRRLYGLTWPSGHFVRLDLKTGLRDLGPIPGQLPDVPVYRALCRAPVVDPDDGSVYFTTVDGLILRYAFARDALEVLKGEDMKKDYFGQFDPNVPGHMGYNWRQTFWYAPQHVVYGVHGNSGYLFRFDPAVPRIDVLDLITSQPSKRSGMFDEFSFGYLGFALGPDGQTIYYLTGGPIYIDGKRVTGKATTAKGEARGLEDLHLVTWHIPTARYADHGAIFYENGERPLYVNSLTLGKDGTVYSLGRITEGGKTRADFFSVRVR